MQFERLRQSAAPKRTRSLKYRSLVSTLCAAAAIAGAPATHAQDNVLTYHNDIGRTGQYLTEHYLIPGNVNSAQFGKLFADGVDGLVYAQPLYVSNVTIPNIGLRNVVYVATERDNVYAFNADSGLTGPIWSVTFTNAAQGITPGNSTDTKAGDVGPDVGITSTPVIDATSSTMYVVATTKQGNKYSQKLHALDLATGAEKFGGPVLISGSVKGIGDGNLGGNVVFDALKEGQRPALLLHGGTVYIAWASHGDNAPYHGWIMGYDAKSLSQVVLFNTTPNGADGGVWESGDGPAMDALGNMYLVTGNGSFDANLGGPNYGDSYLKFSTSLGLNVTDYFTPFDQANLNVKDLDTGSGGLVVLPDQPGPHPHLMIGGSKNGTMYVMDRDNLGKFTSGRNACLQSLSNTIKGAFSSPAYFNGQIYYMASGEGTADVLQAFPFSSVTGLLNQVPASKSSISIGYPGATPSITANGNQNGIVWLIDPVASSGAPAILRAFDAANIGSELYNSNQAPVRADNPGAAIKWATPTIANGKVYVATTGQLAVYGLKPNSLTPVLSLTATNVSFPGGGSTPAQVSLTTAAPAIGAIVNITTDSPAIVTVPLTVSVATGLTSVPFTIKTKNVAAKTTVQVFATAGGVTKTVSLDILPANPAGFGVALPSTEQAGNSGTGNVFLNVTQGTSATFRLTSSDPGAFSVPATVIVVAGADHVSFPYSVGIISSPRTVTVTGTSVATGATTSVDIALSVLTGSNFPAGINFFSIPLDYPGVNLDALFGYTGVNLEVWNPSLLTWALTPTPPADQIRAGRAYWARFPHNVTLTRGGTVIDSTQDFKIQLSTGWNQIGDPFTSSVPLSSLTFALGRLTFRDASSPIYHVINPSIYRYDTGANKYVLVGATKTLDPGVGYWMQSYIDTDATVPHL